MHDGAMAHVLGHSTHTIELLQIQQINTGLTAGSATTSMTASAIGVAGAAVRADSLDTVAAHRAHLPAHLSEASLGRGTVAADAHLVQVVAAGPPSFPYVYGLFRTAAGGADGPLLPVPLHTEHLQKISGSLHLHHRWGVA